MKIGLVGYACGIGGSILGAKDGPQRLRDQSLITRLVDLGHHVTDYGDAIPDHESEDTFNILRAAHPQEKSAKNIARIYTACKHLNDLTKQVLEDGKTPIIIGGDHSCSIGSVAALADHYHDQNQSLGLIWIDTHADINTPATSLSGNLHGMSNAFLLGMVPGIFLNLCKTKPAISPKNLVYIGLRDVDNAEKYIIKDSGISAFTMKDIDKVGIAKVVEQAIEIASESTAGFVSSFDLDVCDPQLAPATGTPMRGGLTYREAHLLMEMIFDSKKMLAAEFVELNPSLDSENKTAELAVALIESAFGKSIL